LAAVQGLELSPQLLIFQLHLMSLSALLIQLRREFFQLVFVVTLNAGRTLILAPDPLGG
jgi:hypothetical protein